MDENPYQAPQSPPEPRPTPRRKAVLGLSLLTLLSIPAATVADFATCGGTLVATDSIVAIPVGFLVTLLITAGVQMFQLRPPGDEVMREDGYAIGVRLVLFELLATPIALGLAVFIGWLSYSEVLGDASEALAPVGACTAFLVWSIAAVMAWHWPSAKP